MSTALGLALCFLWGLVSVSSENIVSLSDIGVVLLSVLVCFELLVLRLVAVVEVHMLRISAEDIFLWRVCGLVGAWTTCMCADLPRLL